MNDLDYHLLLGDELFAGSANLSLAWTTPHPRGPLVRKTTIRELISDETADEFSFYDCGAYHGAGHTFDDILPIGEFPSVYVS